MSGWCLFDVTVFPTDPKKSVKDVSFEIINFLRNRYLLLSTPRIERFSRSAIAFVERLSRRYAQSLRSAGVSKG